MIKANASTRRSRGYTLIEVLIGILIFAVGMMALAQLQGNLAKSSGDANARTVAVNVAEEIIETARRFGQITSDGTNAAFNDIVDDVATVERAGFTYTATTVVTDYWYDAATQTFTTTDPGDRISADFKQIDLTVAWDDTPREFNLGDGTQTEGGLGSGSITVTDMISSITSPSGGKVALGKDGGDNFYSPPVDYNPGQNPDIVSINLGDNKFKESTTPLPDVIRSDELVETAFDVVTYSNPNNGTGATFLRREEFRAVSCECTLRVPSGNEGGLRPTVWNGEDYVEGEFVSKPYGESANNQQSSLCDLCCRDHHDGGNGEDDVAGDPGLALYNPFRSSSDFHTSGSLAGNHKHYNRDRNGNMVLADSDGATYVEACRMVRKDGFFRVAQDLRQEGLNSFPADYLDESAEVDVYSGYVTTAVSAFKNSVAYQDSYELGPPSLGLPSQMSPAVVFPASSFANATQMSDATGVTQQQLRSRGIYLDYMSEELRDKINCLDSGGDGESCDVPKVSTALEIIPFYDVQLTWLSRWNETPNNNPIDVSNEAIDDHNTHSRGLAALTSGYGYSTISAAVHSGNLGLTGTDPIDPNYVAEEERYNLYARAVDASAPPPVSGIRISGTITSSVGGVKAADVEIEASGAQCDRTNTGYECVLEDGVNNPRLKVFNYFKRGKVLFACSAELVTHGEEHSGDTPEQNWTVFNLPENSSSTANIVIREDSC